MIESVLGVQQGCNPGPLFYSNRDPEEVGSHPPNGFKKGLGVKGISLNRNKSQALLANGALPNGVTNEQRLAIDSIALTVVGQGMRVVGVPVRSEELKRNYVKEAINGEPAERVRTLVPKDDAQASFQILSLSAVSRMSHFLRTVPPSITQEASRYFDALIEWR